MGKEEKKEKKEESVSPDPRPIDSSEDSMGEDWLRIHRGLQQFTADHVWIEENRDSLLRQFPEQWIAVENRQVMAHDRDLDGLLKKLPRPAHTCVEFITGEPLEMIL